MADGREGLGAPRALEQRSYEELLRDNLLTDDERLRIQADAILGHMAALLLQRGRTAACQLSLLIKNYAVEYDHESQTTDLWLEYDPSNASSFTEDAEKEYKDVFNELSRRLNYQLDWIGFREILPNIGPDWREQIAAIFDGRRPTNQARRGAPAKPQYVEDSLAFTNPGEQRVYRALKYIQTSQLPRDETISIFPLPNGRILGHTWEPDLLVAYKGRAGVLEIDGPNHNVRRAMDVSRDHLLKDAGIAYIDRITVEALNDSEELIAALKRFLKRLAEVR